MAISTSSLPDSLRFVEANTDIDGPSRIAKRSASRNVVASVLTAELPDDASVLEVGCGTGELYRLLPHNLKQEYIGLDNEADYLEFNRRQNPGVDLREGDIADLPGAANSYAAVLALNVLDVVPDFDAALQEINRVLKPGGSMVHFHDRRPNLGFLIRRLPNGFIPLPYVNQAEQFDRFRLIDRAAYQSQADDRANSLKGWVRMLEQADLSAFDRVHGAWPGVIELLAECTETQFGHVEPDDPSLTPGFKALFTRVTADALKAAGLEVSFAGDIPAEAAVPDSYIDPLICHSVLVPPFASSNTFIIDENGYYSFAETPNGLPKGETLVKTKMNVIVAKKPKA
jgi:SAM-dependent methyltransferase